MKKILSIMCGLLILISSVFNVNVFAKAEIPIAMCLDNNYTLPTIVAMTSMLENVQKGTEYKYYLLVSGDFTQENKQKILSLKEKYKSKQFDINFIDMKDEFKDAKQSRLGAAAYYRLVLPNLLSHYDKCVYLDGDTIVNKDLSEFFNIDVKDYYVGGVKDFDHGDWHHKNLAVLGIDNSWYINSGVLLMNLKKLRDDKIENKFKWLFKDKLEYCGFADQDILNACCYGKIKLLSQKYNAMCEVENPVIRHFAGNKPWKNFGAFLAEKWWEYAVKSGFYDKVPKALEIKKKILEVRNNPKSSANKTLEDGIYTISSKLAPNMCLDINHSSKEEKANLQLWQKNGTDAQKFKIQYDPDGYYTIKAMCSGKFIDVSASGKQNGTNIWQYIGNGTDAQKWFIVPDGEGFYCLVSKCNSLCMDVCGAKATNGANIHCWSIHAGDNQRFKLEKCEGKLSSSKPNKARKLAGKHRPNKPGNSKKSA